VPDLAYRLVFAVCFSCFNSVAVPEWILFIVSCIRSLACESLQEEASVILELSDQKARGFLVPIALKRLLLEHAHKVFGEMHMRI
jgi:hypothetical protein